MAGAKDAFDDFFDDDPLEEVPDTKPDGRLRRIPLGRIAPNRVNPRTFFGTPEALEEMGRSLRRRQIQAVPVVSRAAYLKLWPEHELDVGDVDVVIVSGERRYRAAQAVGLPALDAVINDDLAETRKTFMDAVVTENVARENFDPIEEAAAIEALVETFGTATEVAAHFEKSSTWVSQRRTLLHLAPEIQEQVRARDIPVEPARTLASLAKKQQWTAQQQTAWWEEEQDRRATAASEAKAMRARQRAAKLANAGTPAPEPLQAPPSVFSAEKTEPAPTPAAPPQRTTAQPSAPPVPQAVAPAAPAAVPAQRPDNVEQSSAPGPLDWGDLDSVFAHLTQNLGRQDQQALSVRLIKHLSEKVAA